MCFYKMKKEGLLLKILKMEGIGTNIYIYNFLQYVAIILHVMFILSGAVSGLRERSS